MKLLHESRIDSSVDAANIGIGETVSVLTKMGKSVSNGKVIAGNPFGVVLEDGVFYRRDLYLFCPVIDSPTIEIQNELHGKSPDERAMDKMLKMGIIEADSNGIENTKKEKKDDIDDGSKDIDKSNVKDTDKNSSSNDNTKKEPSKDQEKQFDVNKLPDDIKKAVISADKMSEVQIDALLSDITEASIKAMKNSNVSEDDIYSHVLKIRESVKEIFGDK